MPHRRPEKKLSVEWSGALETSDGSDLCEITRKRGSSIDPYPSLCAQSIDHCWERKKEEEEEENSSHFSRIDVHDRANGVKGTLFFIFTNFR